jgi:hypothetical protein
MKELTIAFDMSSSLLKAIYTTDSQSGEMKLLTLPVEVIPVTPEWIELHRKTSAFDIAGGENIHVRVGRSHYAVGRLAKEGMGARDSLREVKAERGVIRTVAMVGAIAARERLPESFRVRLGVLLPYGEINDREVFGKKVGEALKEFGFKGRDYRVELTRLSCLPEGSGVLLRGKTVGKPLETCELLILSIGYRNASYLLYRSGKVVEGDTTELGFHDLLKNIVSMTSGLKVEELLPLVLKYKKYKRQNLTNREFIEMEEETFLKIIKKSEDLGAARRKLIRAIRVADEGYWLTLSDWLTTRRFPKVDEVILTGGTANYLRFELENYFKRERKSWGDNIEKIVRNRLVSDNEYLEKYRYRLTDNCGFFFYLNYDRTRKLAHENN